ncbi:MAG: hypothetical protein M1834_006113 [Cirrosporium novae-zelandiae]|nr:MAG: hypothetical protein M1834_006113 [Cirrosporium novae-zelandiae]
MALKVRHLNADSTYLLTFSPSETSTDSVLPPSPRSFDDPDCFSILVDPWLCGSCSVLHPRFALTRHSSPPLIQHLSEIPDPDVVLISQDKPDHCHEETLRQLSPDTRALIIAEPRAARKIRQFKHFPRSRIFSLPRYDSRKRNTICRIQIPALSFHGSPGEVTLTLLTPKFDMTGLHNAIGITYRPPTSSGNPSGGKAPPTTSFDLPIQSASGFDEYIPPVPPLPALRPAMSMPNMASPLISPQVDSNFDASSTYAESTYAESTSSSVFTLPIQGFNRPNMHKRASTIMTLDLPIQYPSTSVAPTCKSTVRLPIQHNTVRFNEPLPTPPDSPASSSSTLPDCSRTTSHNRTPPLPPAANPQILSVLYAPHGINLVSVLPYLSAHISPMTSHLSLLLHPFTRVTSPWYLGGCISTGAPGGTEIARAFDARCWVSTHDGRKEVSGASVKRVKRQCWEVGEIRKMVKGIDNHDDEEEVWGCGGCEVRIMEAGEEMVMVADIG